MKRSWSAQVGDAAFLLPALLVAFMAAYPIYQTRRYVLAVACAVVLGAAVAKLSSLLRLNVWATLGIAFGVYVLAGVPLAAPEVFWAPETLGSQVLGVLAAPVVGWKQILTLQVPLGAYHQVMAPFFFMAVFVSLGVFLLAWGERTPWALAALVVLLPLLVGTALGPESLAHLTLPWVLGSATAWQLQALLGALLTLVLFGWLFWRPWQQNRPAVRVTQGAKGRWLAVRGGRWAMALFMLASAGFASFVVTPHYADGQRVTLRKDVNVDLVVATQTSPLSTYRDYFSNEMFNETMFTVDSGWDRVRVATMSTYDGYSLGSSAAGGGSAAQFFAPLPSKLKPAGAEGAPELGSVRIGAYTGPWVPLPGTLGSLTFQGSEKADLLDGFFYNRDTGTGVEIAKPGLASGSEYSTTTWDTFVPTEQVRSFAPSGMGSAYSSPVPDVVKEWVDAQDQPRTGEGLLDLISRLRMRGYLSHSLSADQGGQVRLWMQAMPGYVFEPSRGGHSLDRILSLFEKLNERADAAGPNATESELVGAVGDDEQFAVAALLVADALGFDARVVLGARLAAVEGEDLPVCNNGDCTGGDMAVWIEVRDATTGAWAPIDVTPQHAWPMSPRVEETSDPKYGTEVLPLGVNVQPAPEAKPTGGESQDEAPDQSLTEDLVASPAFRVGGIAVLGLLVLITPFLTVYALKALRTRRRRRHPDPRRRVLAAWDDYRDRARDYKYITKAGSTRVEFAEQLAFEDDSARRLADMADESTFHIPSNPVAYSQEAWKLSGAAKANLAEGVSKYRALKARFSLRSLSLRKAKIGRKGREVHSYVDA